jgi:hypothetical protein
MDEYRSGRQERPVCLSFLAVLAEMMDEIG